MMPLGQPESVPLASSDASFSDDGLRSEPSFGSLQELEYVDRWPIEAPPPPSDDEGPLTPRIGPALSLDEDDDGARVETVDLTTRRAPREAHHRKPGVAGPRRDAARRAGRRRAVHLCSAYLGRLRGARGRQSRAQRRVVGRGDADARRDAGTPSRRSTRTRAASGGIGHPLDASSSEESLVKFGRRPRSWALPGCSVAARFDAAASDSDAEPPLPPAPPELPRSPSSNLDLWLVRRGLGKYLDAVAALGARRVSDLVFIDDDDLDSLGMTPEERAAIRIHVAC